jgi:hypothetical protein
MDAQDLRVDITDDDVRVARRLWLAALDDPEAPEERTARLHEDLRLLIHAQAQQIAEDFRRAHRTAQRAVAAELRAQRRAAAASD